MRKLKIITIVILFIFIYSIFFYGETGGEEDQQDQKAIIITPAPTITFTYPAEGDNLEPGSYQTITWDKTGTQDVEVRIYLMRDDTIVQTLTTNTENDGNFTWQVPINLESASNYVFRIENLYMPVKGDSEPVSISAKAITYKWDFGDGTKAAGPNPTHIYANPGTYHWILDTTMNGITCQKKGTVTIQPAPTITFTYPSAGNNLEPGSYQTITWNKTGHQDAQVSIKLLHNDALLQTLAANTENDGFFTWQVPIDLEPAGDYVFRVETLYMPVKGDSEPVNISPEQITYKWDFGDGTQATGPNPTHIYAEPGTYHWTLDTAMNGITCQKKGTVTIQPAPTITFTYPSAGHNLEPGSYQTITWSKTGFQDAQVRLKLLRGDTLLQTLAANTENDGAITWQVPINLEFASDYVFRVETLYMPVHGDSEPVNISAEQIAYKWDFGDGTQATGPNPTHIYAEPGTYHWTLDTALNGITCQKKGTIDILGPYITIYKPRQGDNVEPGYGYTITWSKTGPQAEWVKIDLQKNGTTVLNISPRTENDGSYTWQVSLDQETGTGYTIRIETEDSAVAAGSETFDIAVIPVVYQWDFGDGTPLSNEANPEHVYTKTGQFTWKMTAVKGEETCEKTGVITVRPKPAITITSPRQGDKYEPGYLYTVTWTRTGAQAEWVKIDLQKNGTTVLNLSQRTENDGSFTWQVPQNQETGSGYTIRIETEDSEVSSHSESFNITIIPVAYEWDFGDGSPPSNESNPQHVYTKTGQFTWKMTAVKGEETCEKTGIINVRPKPAITVTSPNQGDNVEPGYVYTITWTRAGPQAEWVKIDLQRNGTIALNISPRTENDGSFTWQVPQNQETGSGYTIRIETEDSGLSSHSESFSISIIPVAYEWDFGDGTPHSNEANPQHVYTKTGQFTWKMIAIKGEETCEKTGVIKVWPKPAINITGPKQGDNIEPGYPCTVTWTSTGPQAEWVKIDLQRNGTTALYISPRTENDGSYTWQVPQNQETGTGYTIRIETEDSGVSSQSESFSINIIPVAYEWDFGDGTPHSNEANPEHVYTKTGQFTWKMTATKGEEACQKTGIIQVLPKDLITFTYPYQGDNLEPGSYQTITWNETGAQDAQVSIKLLRNDTLVKTLAASTENDGAFTWQVPVNLESAVDYVFRIETLTTQYRVDSEPVSIAAKPITYKWDFGDGTQAAGPNPTHIYAKPGTYNWTLDTTMNGKTCQKKGTVTIQPAPTITFTYPSVGYNLEAGSYQTITWNKTGFQDAQVSIKLLRNDTLLQTLAANTENDGAFTWQVPTNLEPVADYIFRVETLYMPVYGDSEPVSISSKAITYKWDFGDGTQATGPNPKHVYEKPDTYHWTLDTTMNGITCQKKGTVTIQPAPTITFTYPSAGHNLESGSYQTITWDKTGFQDAQVRIKLLRNETLVQTLASTTENDGAFTWQVPLTLESASDYTLRIETLYMPLQGNSDPVSITAKAIIYKWDFGDGTESTEANPIHIYAIPGTYHWTLDTTMDGKTCRKKGSVTIKDAPTITFTYPGENNNLEPGSYQTITWNKTGFQDARVRIKLLRKDTLLQTLAANTENDGAFTWQVPVNLEPAADYMFRIETLYMPVQGDSNPVSIAAKEITYKWDFGDGTQSTEANPNHIYEKPGQYKWTLDTTMDGLTCHKEGIIDTGPAPTITFSYPQKGYNLEPGSYQTITWDKTGFQDAQVRIKLLRNDTLVQTLATSTENDGAFTWQVPINLESASDYKFRIETLYMPLHGESEPVSIIAKEITYKWDFGDNTQATDSNPTHIYKKPGIYNWKMEVEMDGITCSSTGAVIFPGMYIMITNPKQGDNLPIGSHCTITWIKSEIPDATVKIDLLKNGAKVLTISPQTENDGSFDWTVPASQEPGTDYALFMETTDTHINRIGFRFSISKPAIPVAERAALIALYNSTNGDNWTNNDGWKTPPLHSDGFAAPGTENTWHGVTCNTENTAIIYLHLKNNNLEGTIPPQLGNLTNLISLRLKDNRLTGSIPGELGNLTNLEFITLESNQLSGSIPPELGKLTNLIYLFLQGNQLKGEIPTTLTNLVKLKTGSPNILYNLLYTNDETLAAFLNTNVSGWQSTQTIAPSEVSAAVSTDNSITVSWTPIPYTKDKGGYQVSYGKTAGGPYPFSKTTTDKTASTLNVSDLEPGTTYYCVVQTRTEPHQYNENALESDYSQEISVTATSITIIPNDPDFNNDGKVDILWRNNTTGENMVWYMDGIHTIASENLETKDNLKWKIVGTGDFNGDGKVDILWRNFTNGKNRVWFMDGITKTGAKGLKMWDNLKWRIVGTGDFNGDGKVDILWRNFTNGKNRVWFMDGITRISAKGLEKKIGESWRIVGTGDFNSDGKVDILWRHFTKGKNRVWFMDGITKIDAKGLEMNTNMKWEIVGTGDFNGDNKVDILWRNYTKGKNRVWFMDGVTKTGAKGLDSLPDTNWKIFDSGD